MKKLMDRSATAPLLLACTGFLAQPAAAQVIDRAAPESALALSVEAAVVSDYRFRGVSMSNRRPALQGGVDMTTRSGWFVGAWASTIADDGGADAEIDLYTGYSRSVAGFDLTVGSHAYVYPGGDDLNYLEASSTIGRTFGKAAIEAELAFVPRQKNVDSANVYAGLTMSRQIADLPLRLKVRGGFEDGFIDRKWDWEGGVEFEYQSLTASLSAVGSNRGGANEEGRLARTGLVAGLTLGL